MDLKALKLKFNGGFIFTSDISNTHSTSNTILLPKSSPFGVKIGTGLQYMWNNIGAEFDISFSKIGQSELQNRWHPKISYTMVLLNFGVVYKL